MKKALNFVVKHLKAKKHLILSIIFVAITLCLIERKVLIEVKDGDTQHYISCVGNFPNDQPPLVYVLLNFVGFFLDPLTTFLSVELFLHGALFITIYMVVVAVYGSHPIFSFYYFFFFYDLRNIFYGSPLKQILGLLLFFVFVGVFEHFKSKLELNRKFVLGLIVVLALLSHIVGFVLIIGFLLIYFLLKYFKNKSITPSSVFKFGVIPTLVFSVAFYVFKDYFFFRSLLKLGRLLRINFFTVTLNFTRLINDYNRPFFIYFLIYAVSLVVNWKKANYVSLSVLLVCSFFFFGATDADYFFRFTSIVPLILFLGYCELFHNVLAGSKFGFWRHKT